MDLEYAHAAQMTDDITIPDSLDGWTFSTISRLLAVNVYEDQRFDWKQDLRGDTGRFVRNCAGMANAGGGFIVLGVADSRSDLPADRIKGIEDRRDIANDVGTVLANADPGVPHQLRTPPVRIPDRPGWLLPVLQILNVQAPHSVNGAFTVRHGGTTRAMTTAEVRDMMVRREDTIQKLRLMLFELAAAREAAIAVSLAQQTRQSQFLRKIDTRMLAELHAATAPTLLHAPEISAALTKIRSCAAAMNYRLDAALKIFFHPAYSSKDVHANFDFLIDFRQASRIPRLVEAVVAQIAQQFGLPAPPLRADHELRSDLGY